jgi:flagellar protein FliO/FliZ
LSLDIYTRFVLALAAILVLLGLFAWLGRRFGLAGRPARGGKRRLAIVEIAPIDGKRRLVLLRRDHTEHLVLLGPDSALLVERGIVESGIAGPLERPAFATLVDGAAPS